MSSYSQGSSDDPSSSNLSGAIFPVDVNRWKTEHLQHLVSVDNDTCSWNPKDIVDLLIGFKPSENSDFILWTKQISNLRKIVKEIKELMESSKAYGQYGFDISFKDLTPDKAIIDLVATRNDMWEISSDSKNNNHKFKTLFEEAGKNFTDVLIKCIHTKENGRLIDEKIYQLLFVSFLKLFNIRCNCAPCVTEQSMTVCGQTVKGQPDITVELLKFHSKRYDHSTIDWKFLTVCKIKKEDNKDAESPPNKKRKPCTTSIADDLLGQLGGELLLHYPLSVTDNYILGLMVEQTNIRFAALSITKEEYKHLMEGSLNSDREEKRPKIYLTKPYDFLIWKDRICITEALLTLGYLQRHASEYFFK